MAGVSYRQLGYWEQQGWVTATAVEQVSAGRRVRRYGPDDVVRLAALRHLAMSGFDVATFGPRIGRIELGEGRLLVAGGDGGDELEVIGVDELTATVTRMGRWTVFDPVPLLRQLRSADPVAEQRRLAGDVEVLEARRTA